MITKEFRLVRDHRKRISIREVFVDSFDSVVEMDAEPLVIEGASVKSITKLLEVLMNTAIVKPVLQETSYEDLAEEATTDTIYEDIEDEEQELEDLFETFKVK